MINQSLMTLILLSVPLSNNKATTKSRTSPARLSVASAVAVNDNDIDIDSSDTTVIHTHTAESVVEASIALSTQSAPSVHRLSYDELNDLECGPAHPLLSYSSYSENVARIAIRSLQF